MAETDARDAELVEVARTAFWRNLAGRIDSDSTVPGWFPALQDEAFAAAIAAVAPLIREQEQEACMKIAQAEKIECAEERDKNTDDVAQLAWNMCCNTAGIIEDNIRQRNPAEG